LLFFSDVVFALFVLFLFLLFARPYHAIKSSADAFDAASNCATVSTTQSLPGPCSIEWANVTLRYFQSSHTGKTGPHYTYLVRLRGGYGDEHTVIIPDANVWWRITNGSAVIVQRWGNRFTAIQSTNGATSSTRDNPDWQLANELRALRVLGIVFVCMLAFALLSGVAWRLLPQ